MATRQAFFWRGVTQRQFINALQGYNAENSGSFEICGSSIISAPGTFSNLRAVIASALTSTQVKHFYLRVNGVDSSLGVDFSSSTSADLTDTTHTVHVNAGDVVTVRYTEANFSGTLGLYLTLEFVPDTDGQTIYGSSEDVFGPSNGQITAPMYGDHYAALSPDQDRGEGSLIPTPGTLTRIDHKLNSAPGVGTSIIFTIYKNGVAQDGSGGTPDTRCTISGTNVAASSTFSLSLVESDWIYVKATTGSGSPSYSNSCGGCCFVPDAVGTWIRIASNIGAPDQTTPNFWDHESEAPFSATETDHDLIGPHTTCYIAGVSVLLAWAPGTGKSWTVQPRLNGFDSSPVAIVADSAVAGGSTVSSTTITSADKWSLKDTPTNTPAPGTAKGTMYALVMSDRASPFAGDFIRITQVALEAVVDPRTATSAYCSLPTPAYESPCSITVPERFQVISAISVPAVPNPTYDQIYAADVPMRDTNWYGNWKPQRIAKVGALRRAASNFVTGAMEAQSGSATWVDPDGEVQKFIYDHGLTLVGASIYDYIVDHATRKAGGVPRLRFQGYIVDDTLDANRLRSFQYRDVIGSGYSVLESDLMVPQRSIEVDFPGYGYTGIDSLTINTLGAPIVFGPMSDASAATPLGLVPVIPVGKRMCADGVVRWIGMIAGHACQGGVINVYDETTTGTPPVPAPISPAWGTWGFAPGQAGWAAVNGSAALYTEINGRWYTLIALNTNTAYGADNTDDFGSGKKRLWANVNGLEDMGDGTGDLIVNLHLQYHHILVNFFLGNWQSGPWLTSPAFDTFPGGDLLCRVDAASFVAASQLGSYYIASGFLGAGIVGVNGQQQALRSVLAKFNIQCLGWLYYDQYNRYAFRMLDRRRANMVDTSKARTDRYNTLDSKPMTAKFQRDLMANHFRAGAQLDLHNNKYTALGELEDGISVSRYQLRMPQGEGYDYIRDIPTAEAVANERMRFRSTSRRLITWRESLCGLELNPVDAFPLTHFNLDDNSGTPKTTSVLVTAVVDNGDNTVDIEAMEIEDLLVDPVTSIYGATVLGSSLDSYLAIVPGVAVVGGNP